MKQQVFISNVQSEFIEERRALDDIDPKTIRQFIRLAHSKRQLSLPDSTPVPGVLAHRDLVEMVSKEVLLKQGTTGKGVSYHLSKGATKGPKGPNRTSLFTNVAEMLLYQQSSQP